jgi:hypothetical protein
MCVDYIHVAQDRVQWRVRYHGNSEEMLACQVAMSWLRILLHRVRDATRKINRYYIRRIHLTDMHQSSLLYAHERQAKPVWDNRAHAIGSLTSNWKGRQAVKKLWSLWEGALYFIYKKKASYKSARRWCDAFHSLNDQTGWKRLKWKSGRVTA